MAQKVQVILVDDLDGGVADETVTFGLDGVLYEIDLSAAHAKELRDTLVTWTATARKSGRAATAARGSARRRTVEGPSANEIREWARSNGHSVNERGRISQEIRDAYTAAH